MTFRIFIFTLVFSVFAPVLNLSAQDVKLGLAFNDAGTELTSYLISEPTCSGNGITQATVTIRWTKGGTPLGTDAIAHLSNMNVSCGLGGVDFPESSTHDYLFCSIEPTPNTNIPITFTSNEPIPVFTVGVAALGEWMYEDLDNGTVLGGDETKPYVNINQSPCATATSDNNNYIQIDAAYHVQTISNDNTPLDSEEEVIRSFSLTDAFPNPSMGSSRVSFSLAKNDNVKLSLHDSTGAHIRDVFEGDVPAGVLKELTIKTEGLSAGTYFYKLEGHYFQSEAKSLTVIK